MNENQIIPLVGAKHQAIKDFANMSLAKLSGKELLIGLGIICITVIGTAGVVCVTGSELTVGNGKFTITQPGYKEFA